MGDFTALVKGTTTNIQRSLDNSASKLNYNLRSSSYSYHDGRPLPPAHDSLMLTTHRMQSPDFIASKALLILASGSRCVMKSSTFSLPAM